VADQDDRVEARLGNSKGIPLTVPLSIIIGRGTVRGIPLEFPKQDSGKFSVIEIRGYPLLVDSMMRTQNGI
jgi:hypothetical protein